MWAFVAPLESLLGLPDSRLGCRKQPTFPHTVFAIPVLVSSQSAGTCCLFPPGGIRAETQDEREKGERERELFLGDNCSSQTSSQVLHFQASERRMDQVISAALSSHPIAVSGVEKAPSSSCSFVSSAKSSRLLKYKSYQRLWFSTNIRNRGMVLPRNQHCLVHAIPLQAVTTDNDSEGSTSPGPSSSVEYAGIFQPEQGAQHSLLYCIRVWYTNAKAQNVPVSIQQVLERSKMELQTVDKCQILKQIKSSKLVTFGIHWWESSQPWVKWPISIFIPWFLLVSLFYGMSASMDLLPLWVIGPLFTGLAIKSSVQLCESYRQWVVHRKMMELLTYMRDGFKSGELPRQTVEALGSRFEELKTHSNRKKEDLEIFLRSGEYKKVLRDYADKKLLELQEACIDKYEDWRLWYLYLERKVKNII